MAIFHSAFCHSFLDSNSSSSSVLCGWLVTHTLSQLTQILSKFSERINCKVIWQYAILRNSICDQVQSRFGTKEQPMIKKISRFYLSFPWFPKDLLFQVFRVFCKFSYRHTPHSSQLQKFGWKRKRELRRSLRDMKKNNPQELGSNSGLGRNWIDWKEILADYNALLFLFRFLIKIKGQAITQHLSHCFPLLKFYRVSKSFTGFSQVSPSFSGFLQVFLPPEFPKLV